jgi:hypothetical protein
MTPSTARAATIVRSVTQYPAVCNRFLSHCTGDKAAGWFAI